MKKLFEILVLSLLISGNVFAEYQGRYCEMDGAYTSSGKAVYGEFYMYSENHGEAGPILNIHKPNLIKVKNLSAILSRKTTPRNILPIIH